MDIILIIAVFFGLLIGIFLGIYIGKLLSSLKFKEQIKEERKDAISRSRAVLSGMFSEQLAPYLPGFKYNAGECKFIGKPVDFIVFKGLDNKNSESKKSKIDEIVFVEVKTGNSNLTVFEKSVKEAIENGRVRFEEYRFDL